MKNKKTFIMFLIIILVLMIIGLLIYLNSNKGFKGKIPKTIEISKTYGGAPSTEEYKINLQNKETTLKKWSVEEGNDETTYSLSKEQINDINEIFKSYNATNIEEIDRDVAGGVSNDLSVKFYDGTKLKIHTYGEIEYLKGDNKKLFEELLEYVESIFKGE